MRATQLGFRNPKEETPAAYYPKKTNDGRLLNRFEKALESESKAGTWSKDQRFYQGSIYKNVVDRTTKRVGPGCYKDEQTVHILKKKPCMTAIHRPEIAPNESIFDMQGHMRILQKSYLPRPHQEQFDTIMHQYQGKMGRKVNNTFVFRKALEAATSEEGETASQQTRVANAALNVTTDSLQGSKMQHKRNQSTFSQGSAGTSPVDAHVSRIRACYQGKLQEREEFFSTRFLSPRISTQRSTFHSPIKQQQQMFKVNTNAFNSRQASHRSKVDLSGAYRNGVSLDRPMTQPDRSLASADRGQPIEMRSMAGEPEQHTSDRGNTKSFEPFMNSKEEDTTISCIHPKFSQREAKAEDSILASSTGDQKNTVIVCSDSEAGAQGHQTIKNGRYQDRDSWRKIQAAYSTVRARGGRSVNRRRIPGLAMTQEQLGQRPSFDQKGKIMRDILSTTTAVELAISQERDTNNNGQQSTMLQQAQAKANQTSTPVERRVKTAERTSRPMRLGYTSRGSRRLEQPTVNGQKPPHSFVMSNDSLATTGPATTTAAQNNQFHERSQPFSEGD